MEVYAPIGHSLVVAAMSLTLLSCGATESSLPEPPRRLANYTDTQALPGCAISSVQVRYRVPLIGGDDPNGLSSAEVCFAIRALKAWADAAFPGEPLLEPGDGERIAEYWLEPYPPFERLPSDLFTIGAEVPGRPRTLWVQVHRSYLTVRFGLTHR